MERQIVLKEKELVDFCEDSTLNVVNEIMSQAGCFTFEYWDEYDKNEMNNTLSVYKKKHLKIFVAKLEMIWKNIQYFDIKINQKAFYFIRYMINTYS